MEKVLEVASHRAIKKHIDALSKVHEAYGHTIDRTLEAIKSMQNLKANSTIKL